jgi:xanthine dehydrogenase YagS FAD-binding subunit
MRAFVYAKAPDVASALAALGERDTRAMAGGTELVNWMRDGIESPRRVVDISGLPLQAIEVTPRGLRLGALVTMSDVAAHPEVRSAYPVLAQ